MATQREEDRPAGSLAALGVAGAAAVEEAHRLTAPWAERGGGWRTQKPGWGEEKGVGWKGGGQMKVEAQNLKFKLDISEKSKIQIWKLEKRKSNV